MTSHAFQFLVEDDDLHASLVAIRSALHPDGHFAFETRNPQACAWETWNPSNTSDVVDTSGRALRVWHNVEHIVGDVVTFTGTTAEADGRVLRVDRTSLRFLEPITLDAFLTGAGFEIEARFGDWQRGPLNDESREIITIAKPK